jgi:hypothetical protein
LILAARTVRDVLVSLTAFTAAHSLSLALVVIGGIHASASLVEPLIAASIVWVGLENLVRGGSRSRWPLVFGFGLIHGFGFAGALIELGLRSISFRDRGGTSILQRGCRGRATCRGGMRSPVGVADAPSPVWQAGVMSTCSMAMGHRGGYWLIDRLLYSAKAARAFYKVPTRYFSPVGEGTPPAGSMVTAIATVAECPAAC